MIILPPADGSYACVDDLRIACAQYSYSLLLRLTSFFAFSPYSLIPGQLRGSSLPLGLKTFQITLGIKIPPPTSEYFVSTFSFLVTVKGNEE